MRNSLRLLLIFWSLVVLTSGCSTYTSLDPRATSASGKEVDRTLNEYGQPYYLPKGLIHLTIAPVEPPKKADPKPTPAPTAAAKKKAADAKKKAEALAKAKDEKKDGDDPAQGAIPNGEAEPETAEVKEEKPADFGFSSGPYKITVERLLVPDMRYGPYYAHLSQNWLYAEKAALAVNAEGLLTTATATSSDRTGQILNNIAETAINIVKTTQGAFFATEDKPKVAIKQVRYRKLAIDIIFDTTDEAQVRAVMAEVNGQEEAEDKDGNKVVLLSPLNLTIKSPLYPDINTTPPFACAAPSTAIAFSKAAPKNEGLYFREGTPLELVFSQNDEAFKKEAALALAAFDTQLQAAVKDFERKAKELKESEDRKDSEEKKDAAVAAKNEANTTMVSLQENARSGWIAALKTYQVSGTVPHAKGVFVKAVPNPNRVFAFNVSRSAFVQNKKTELTITDGMLLGFNIEKASEIEGFTEIPLNLSQKVLALPKDLLTLRTENVNASKALNDAQNALGNAKQTQATLEANRSSAEIVAQLNAETARLNAETAKLEAEAKLLKQQEANDASN